jgi:MOSC domain-containing protein YiiM
VALLDSVNVGRPVPNPYKETRATGITKVPQTQPVGVRAPGPKGTGSASGVVGDYIGDGKHHGGDDQALYAVAREDLDAWERQLSRGLPNGFFGENLTTTGLDVNEALVGERWLIGGEVVVQVTYPRIPCSTFRGQMGERGWLRTFTLAGKPGAYLRIVTPGVIQAGDPIEIVHRPEHHVTVALAFRALMVQHDLLPQLLAAGGDLPEELRQSAEEYETVQAALPGT